MTQEPQSGSLQQLTLPANLQLRPRIWPAWLRFGVPVRVMRDQCDDVLVESEAEAVARGRQERVKQGFGEQLRLPWPT